MSKKSDANLLRPRYVASRPNIRTQWVLPTILLILQTIKVLVVAEMLHLEHSNLVVIHYLPASTFSDLIGPESHHREHGELFGSGRVA